MIFLINKFSLCVIQDHFCAKNAVFTEHEKATRKNTV